LGKIKNIYINWKHLGTSISLIKFWQFSTASFSCGQLQTVLFEVGLYRIAPLKFECI